MPNSLLCKHFSKTLCLLSATSIPHSYLPYCRCQIMYPGAGWYQRAVASPDRGLRVRRTLRLHPVHDVISLPTNLRHLLGWDVLDPNQRTGRSNDENLLMSPTTPKYLSVSHKWQMIISITNAQRYIILFPNNDEISLRIINIYARILLLIDIQKINNRPY